MLRIHSLALFEMPAFDKLFSYWILILLPFIFPIGEDCSNHFHELFNIDILNNSILIMNFSLMIINFIILYIR